MQLPVFLRYKSAYLKINKFIFNKATFSVLLSMPWFEKKSTKKKNTLFLQIPREEKNIEKDFSYVLKNVLCWRSSQSKILNHYHFHYFLLNLLNNRHPPPKKKIEINTWWMYIFSGWHTKSIFLCLIKSVILIHANLLQ